MKQNLPSTLTIALLTLTVGILFWYGDRKINEANNINSTIVAWENLLNDYLPTVKISQDNLKNLNLTIQNITATKKSYKVEWLVDSKAVDSQKIEVSSQSKKIVSPSKKVLVNLKTLLNNQPEKTSMLYQIKITWSKNQKSEVLGKWLRRK